MDLTDIGLKNLLLFIPIPILTLRFTLRHRYVIIHLCTLPSSTSTPQVIKEVRAPGVHQASFEVKILV